MEFLAYIRPDNNGINIYARDLFEKWKREHSGQEVVVDLQELTRGYTAKARRFYWVLCTIGGQAAGGMDKQDFHSEYKIKVGYTKTIRGLNGEEREIPKSIKKMTKSEFTEYIERLIQFLLTFQGVEFRDDQLFYNYGFIYEQGKLIEIK